MKDNTDFDNLSDISDTILYLNKNRIKNDIDQIKQSIKDKVKAIEEKIEKIKLNTQEKLKQIKEDREKEQESIMENHKSKMDSISKAAESAARNTELRKSEFIKAQEQLFAAKAMSDTKPQKDEEEIDLDKTEEDTSQDLLKISELESKVKKLEEENYALKNSKSDTIKPITEEDILSTEYLKKSSLVIQKLKELKEHGDKNKYLVNFFDYIKENSYISIHDLFKDKRFNDFPIFTEFKEIKETTTKLEL